MVTKPWQNPVSGLAVKPNEAGVEAGYRALLCWSRYLIMQRSCAMYWEKEYAAKSPYCLNKNNQTAQPETGSCLMSIAGLMSPQKACKMSFSVGAADSPPSTDTTCYKHHKAVNINRHWYNPPFWGGMLTWAPLSGILIWIKECGTSGRIWFQRQKGYPRDFGAYCYPGFRHSSIVGHPTNPWWHTTSLGISSEPM